MHKSNNALNKLDNSKGHYDDFIKVDAAIIANYIKSIKFYDNLVVLAKSCSKIIDPSIRDAMKINIFQIISDIISNKHDDINQIVYSDAYKNFSNNEKLNQVWIAQIKGFFGDLWNNVHLDEAMIAKKMLNRDPGDLVFNAEQLEVFLNSVHQAFIKKFRAFCRTDKDLDKIFSDKALADSSIIYDLSSKDILSRHKKNNTL